jgi:UrcA family protein
MTRSLCLALVAASLFAAPALAQTDDNLVKVVVRYGDLNLDTPTGARTLLDRIEAAANEACGGKPDIRDLGALARFDRCRPAAAHRAVSQVDAPRALAMAHREGISPLARR